MVYQRGHGRGGRIVQVKMSLDEDAGEGLIAIEDQLLRGVFVSQAGRRSDVMRLLLRHWVEHPAEIPWMKARWRKDLGEQWPSQSAEPAPREERPSASQMSAAEVVPL